MKEELGDYRWSPDSKQLLLTLRAKDKSEPEKGAKPVPPKPIMLDRYHFKQDVQGYVTDKREHLFLFDISTKNWQTLSNKTKTAFVSDNAYYVYLGCKCKVEVSGFCKVEMSKLPFRQMAEAEIGISDDEWKRVAAH